MTSLTAGRFFVYERVNKLARIIPLIFVLIWSTGFIGAKFALPYIEPFFLLVVRYGLVIVILSAALALRPGKGMTAEEATFQVSIGVLLHGFYLGGVFYAISVAMPAGLVAIIVGLQPVLTTSIGRVWLGNAVSNTQVIGLTLGILGVVLVIVGVDELAKGAFSVDGLIAALLALTGISVGAVLQKEKGGAVRPRSGMLLQYIGAMAVTVPLTLIWETQRVEITLTLVLAMAWLVLGLSVIAILLLMVMIRAGQVARVASYFYLVPPATVFQAWLFFDERISAISAVGAVVSVLGVWLVIREGTPKDQQTG